MGIRWVAACVLIFGASACLLGCTDSNGGTAAPLRCDDPLTGVVAAPAEMTEAFGVVQYSYEVRVLEAAVTIVLEDEAGANAGTLRWASTPGRDDGGSTGVTATLELPDGSTATLEQKHSDPDERFLQENDLRGFARTLISAGGTSLRVNVRSIGEDLTYAEFLVPADLTDEEPTIGVGVSFDDGSYWVKTVIRDGTSIEETVVQSWLEETGRDEIFTAPETAALFGTLASDSLLTGMLEHVDQCFFGESPTVGVNGTISVIEPLSARLEQCGIAPVTAVICVACLTTLPAIIFGDDFRPLLPCIGCIYSTSVLPDAIHKCICGLEGEDCCDQQACQQSCRCGGYCALDRGGLGRTCSCNFTSICCTDERKCPPCKTCGEPHLFTFDNVRFDFQARGEFVVVEATEGVPFVVQSRQVGSQLTNVCGQVSWNSAIAVQLGDHQLGFYVEEPRLRVDGAPLELPWQERRMLGDDAFVLRDGDNEWYVQSDNGEVLYIRVGSSIGLGIEIPETRRGKVRGLLGNFDGDTTGDLATREGTVIEEPVAHDDFYNVWGESWRVTAEESLFDYSSGEDTTTFVGPNPTVQVTVADLPSSLRDPAEQACRTAGLTDGYKLDACVLDLACTGEPDIVQDALRMPDGAEPLPLERPGSFVGWRQEGTTNGDWEILGDDEIGNSVRQNVATTGPSFFVAPRTYDAFRLTMNMNTGTDPDGYLGFVLGYRGPLAANGDAPEEYDTLIVAWKGEAEGTLSTVTAQEGWTLTHVDGTIADIDVVDRFWGQIEGPGYQVVASQYGSDEGWTSGALHNIELVYSADRIEVTARVGPTLYSFAVDAADSPVPFRDGRFGFFTYQMSPVVFRDLSIEPL